MKRYDLNLLAALDALLVEASVSRAARRLGLGQPAMSAALSRLRMLFGDPLLVRTARGMEPTPRARALAGPLRQALVHLRTIVDPVAAFDPSTATRTFRLSGGDYAGMTVLPTLVRQLRENAPGIKLRFRYLEKDGALALLDQEGIDLALCVLNDVPARFASEALIEEEFVCVVRAGHPLLDASLTPKRFSKADHLLVTERGDERGRMDDLLAQHGLSRRIMLTVPSAALVADVLRNSDLIATIPRRAALRITADASLRQIAPPFPVDRWTMSVIWAARNANDSALLWLRNQLQQAASDGASRPARQKAKR